jgi:hypothetical protein
MIVKYRSPAAQLAAVAQWVHTPLEWQASQFAQGVPTASHKIALATWL